MFKKHNTIILESCCGTGKTYSVVKDISSLASKNDVVLSIINRKSSLTAQLKEFENMNVSLNNYMDKDSYNLKERCVCEEPDGNLYRYNEESKELFQTIFLNEDFIRTI